MKDINEDQELKEQLLLAVSGQKDLIREKILFLIRLAKEYKVENDIDIYSLNELNEACEKFAKLPGTEDDWARVKRFIYKHIDKMVDESEIGKIENKNEDTSLEDMYFQEFGKIEQRGLKKQYFIYKNSWWDLVENTSKIVEYLGKINGVPLDIYTPNASGRVGNTVFEFIDQMVIDMASEGQFDERSIHILKDFTVKRIQQEGDFAI